MIVGGLGEPEVRCFPSPGIALLLVGLLAPWSMGGADVVITELMYHPPSDLDGDEFIELLNTGALEIDLQDWCFDGVVLCFPPGATIPSGGRLVLAQDATRFETTYGFPPDHVYTARLDNAGERIALMDGTSLLVDEVNYLDLPPWPVTPDGLGPSLELVDPTLDNATPRNWRASIDPAGQTVGTTNSVDAAGLPPWIEETSHTTDPFPATPIVVTARIHDATTVELYYRIDFEAEMLLAMLDDGASQDGAAGDGTYGVSIPGQAAGTLVRYRIAASGATGSMAFPRDDDTVTYDGTLVQDPALSSSLPVFWWFMDPVDYQASIDHRYTDLLEPAVLYHDGTLIDAIQVRVRGQSARSYPKKHWKFHMPHGHDFYDPDLVPISLDQFNLQGNYSDKTYSRERLSYDTFRESGSPAGITHSVRLQQNGQFYGLYTFLQAMDDDYLTTNHLDENGAWYKAFDNCRYRDLGSLPGRYEKKTRLHEGYEDLHALLDGANNLSGQARRDFLFDNVDLARMANYLATTVAIHNTDFPHKNYFLYRDTQGNGRWTMHPWDMDLTFGRNWQGTVLNDEIWADRDSIPGRPAEVSPSHPLVGEAEHKNWDTRWNALIDALYEEPEFREMYHRRLRTLVDWLLADGRFEGLLDGMTAPMVTEAELDRARWGQYGQAQSIDEAATILKNQYLLPRRTHLLVTHQGPGELPEAQSASPPVIISEIMYDPLGGSVHEFIELYNPSPTEAVDLSGYRLDGVALSLPGGTVILPETYLVVARDDPAFRAEYGSGKFVAAQYGGALDNGGETVRLRDREGNTVARVDYTDDPPWPVSADGDGPSLELIDLTGDNGWVANWAPSAAPGGTPGAPNSMAGSIGTHPGVFINEVLPLNATINPDEQGDYHSWIELFNANPGPVELGGMFLTSLHSQPDLWEIPLGTQLCGGCFLIVWADNEPGEGPLHATFQLNPFGGTVGLYDASGGIVDYTDYGILASDTSYGRFPDGQADRRVFTSVTPAAANDATFIPLILNEYNAVDPDKMLENDGSDVYWGRLVGNGGDWFELVVTEDHLDIRGWELVLTNETGLPGETQQVLTLSDDPLWADLRSGTLITISEELADDTSFDPLNGDWWINVQAADSALGTYITAQDFDVTNLDWQLTILDDSAETVFGPAGEGIVPAGGIGGDEVFKLEQDPGPFITPYAIYNDGSSSTFGAPNLYAAGTIEQEFGLLRCDGQVCSSLDGPCSLGVCDSGSGQCALEPLNEGLTCDDDNACSTGDLCLAGACSGLFPDCSHLDDPCNVGACNPLTLLCEPQPTHEGLSCDDADPCSVADACNVGICLGSPKDCSSADGPCLVGVCNPADGACESQVAADGSSCEDGDACTSGETCAGGSCPAGSPISCDDGNTCTLDDCDPGAGCIFTPDDDQNGDLLPDACDDGDPCSTDDVCTGGSCLGLPLCEDGSICTLDSCDAGVCLHVNSGLCELTGRVLYYRNTGAGVEPGSAPVPGVEIDVDGDLLADAITGSDGGYSLADQAGSPVVSPLDRFGDGEIVDANGAVSSFDASFIARHAVAMIELSTNQQIAADVSGNGSITSFDAARVAQYAVGLIEHFPVAEAAGSDWVFLRCDSYLAADDHDCTTPIYVHDPLLATETDDFYAMLYGDVTGNWEPDARASVPSRGGGPRPAADLLTPGLSPGTSFATRAMELEAVPDGRLRRIVLSVREGASVQALDLKLTYDPRALEVLTLETTDLTREFNLISHDAGGTFRGAAWSTLPLGGSGDVLVLTVLERPTAVETRPLRLEILANEEAFTVEIRGNRTSDEDRPSGRTPRARP